MKWIKNIEENGYTNLMFEWRWYLRNMQEMTIASLRFLSCHCQCTLY